MEINWRAILWQQFGAAIDMLENALRACPEELWNMRLWNEPAAPAGSSEFWYVTYHTLFWLDLYLSGSVEVFSPPAPFTLDELDPAGLMPERQYSKEELGLYLDHCRRKCKTTIESLTEEKAGQNCSFPWGGVSFAELLVDNMRHVQEHAAQLHLVLGQRTGYSNRWIARTGMP